LRWDAEEHLRALDWRVSSALSWRLTKTDGKWSAARDDRPLETRVVEVAGVVGSSLFDAVKRAGEAPALASMLADLIANELNPWTDLQPTDRFKLIVEKRMLGGRFWRYGRVLAIEWLGRTGGWRAFWFSPQDGSPGGLYTDHAEGAQRLLARTPLKLVKLPAGFDRHRAHPIAHLEHAVAGADYAGPPGTPVVAMGAGRVTFVGPRGATMAVVIAHAGGLETTYAHLARVSRGLAAGQEVRPSQVIGWVASAPPPTGSHVHLSIRYNGVAVDPLKLKAPRTAGVSARHRVEFADSIAPRIQSLASLEAR